MENIVSSLDISENRCTPWTHNLLNEHHSDTPDDNSIIVMASGGLAVLHDVNNMHYRAPDSQQQALQQPHDWHPSSTVVGAPPSVESIDSKPVGSPTDLDNNNLSKQRNTSPSQQQQQHTISAAADSSDAQHQAHVSPTHHPQPPISADQQRQSQNHFPATYDTMSSYGNHQAQLQQPLPSMASMHPNPDMQYSFMHSYDPYYHSMEFGPPAPFSQHLHHQQMHDYKSVPSQRYQPYPTHLAPTAAISPRVVSSSGSPALNQHSPMIGGHNQITPPGQPTPSPSPKQCDKCTFVCETSSQMNDHYNTVHTEPEVDPNQLHRASSGDENNMPNFQYQQNQQYTPSVVKDEPNADILDLDSQKMIYPPGANNHQQHQQHHVPLPSMQSLQPQRTMIWSAEHHSFLSTADLKPSMYSTLNPLMVKSEYPISPPIKPSDYGHQSHQMSQHRQDASLTASKSFASDVSSVSHLPTSPSEFPSTTTPAQGMGPTFALDANEKQSPNWKSNEARRPKTYNCTACNKWFTSSGHLKRHYNTTLHKNAVKSSGLPDPATMPINMHHHPHRDQNKVHQRRSPPQPAPHAPPEPPSSPDYGATTTGGAQQQQYSPPLGFPQDFQQQHQQYENASPNHPNGQAGLSVPASQPRGLLIFATNTGTQQQQRAQQHPQGHELYPQQPHHQQPHNMDMLVLDHLQSQQHLTSMDQLVDQHQHHLHLPQDQSQPMEQQHIFMPISTTSSNTSHSTMVMATTNNTNQQEPSLHLLQLPPISTISLDQYHLAPTTTIQQHHHQHLPSPTESIQHTISPCSSTTTTTSSTITTPNQHSYQEPEPVIIQLQAPPLEQQQHQQQNYHIIIGNQQQQELKYDNTELVELTDLSSSGNLLFANVYTDMEDQENMDPVYAMTSNGTYTRMQQGGSIASQYPPPSSLHSPDMAEQFHLVKYTTTTTSPNISQAAVPVTPPLPPAPGASIAPTTTTMTTTASKVSVISPYGTTTLSNNNKDNTTNPTKKPRNKTAAMAKPRSKATDNNSTTLPTAAPPNNGPHRCEECNKVFNKACYLTQHNKTFHSGEKPFKCARCGKRYPTSETHELHFAKHAGDKPFKCKLCPKQFNHKTDLRRHLTLHSGKKPYACEECGKKFIRKDHMMKHVVTHRRKEELMMQKVVAMQEKLRLSKLEGTKVGGRRGAAAARRQPLSMLTKTMVDAMVLNEIEQ